MAAITQWLIYGIAIFILFGVANTVYSLSSSQVTVIRKPLAWYRLAIKLTLALIVVNYVYEQVLGVTGLPRGLTTFGTVIVFLLIGFHWAIEDFVDRREYHQLLRVEAEHQLEQ